MGSPLSEPLWDVLVRPAAEFLPSMHSVPWDSIAEPPGLLASAELTEPCCGLVAGQRILHSEGFLVLPRVLPSGLFSPGTLGTPRSLIPLRPLPLFLPLSQGVGPGRFPTLFSFRDFGPESRSEGSLRTVSSAPALFWVHCPRGRS